MRTQELDTRGREVPDKRWSSELKLQGRKRSVFSLVPASFLLKKEGEENAGGGKQLRFDFRKGEGTCCTA